MTDPWSSLDRLPPEPDRATRLRAAAEADPAAAWRDPHFVSVEFLHALRHLGDPEAQEQLRLLVTPESLPAWGDFADAAALLASVGDWGLGSMPERAFDADDVAYAGILRGVREGFRSESEQLVLAALALTLVWRPEQGAWLVHSIGERVRPEALPRTSPGEAPRGSLID